MACDRRVEELWSTARLQPKDDDDVGDDDDGDDSVPNNVLFVKCFFRLLEERDITLYCDLHGHSRKQNVFIYGCENRFDPLKRLRERVFPAMVSKNVPSKVQCAGS